MTKFYGWAKGGWGELKEPFSTFGLPLQAVLLLNCRDVRRTPVSPLFPLARWAGEMNHLNPLEMWLRHMVGCRIFTNPASFWLGDGGKTLPAWCHVDRPNLVCTKPRSQDFWYFTQTWDPKLLIPFPAQWFPSGALYLPLRWGHYWHILCVHGGIWPKLINALSATWGLV